MSRRSCHQSQSPELPEYMPDLHRSCKKSPFLDFKLRSVHQEDALPIMSMSIIGNALGWFVQGACFTDNAPCHYRSFGGPLALMHEHCIWDARGAVKGWKHNWFEEPM